MGAAWACAKGTRSKYDGRTTFYGSSAKRDSFWEIYRTDPQVILPYLGEIQTLVSRLSVDPRIRLVGTEREDIFTALDLMDDYACLPRDAMHLAVVSRLGIDSLVTTDDDFLPVDGLALFTSNPRILSSH